MSVAPDPPRRPAWLVDHRYNDDLLIELRSRERARTEFFSVFPFLDNPELRAAFSPVDKEARDAKRRSQRAGLGAVVLTVLSLMGAAAEPLWRQLPAPVVTIIAIGAGVLGLAAVAVAAFGVLHGKPKDRWLRHRLGTERLRQLHFQVFIWKLHEIARLSRTPDPHQVERFLADRRQTVESLVDRLAGHADAELTALLAPTGGSELWLYGPGDSPPLAPSGLDRTDPVFTAYRGLRLDEQIGYADHMLRSVSYVSTPLQAPLRNRRQVLRTVWTLAFGGLVVLHIALVVWTLVSWHRVHGPWLHVPVVWLALVALGARTLEEGFGLSREIERYEDYRAAVADARERFDRATTVDDKLRAMIDMERIAFEEMRTFLRTATTPGSCSDAVLLHGHGTRRARPVQDAAAQAARSTCSSAFRLKGTESWELGRDPYAVALASLNDPRAEQIFMEVLTTIPSRETLPDYVDYLWDRGRYHEALQILDRKDSRTLLAIQHAQRGTILERLGRVAEARAEYQFYAQETSKPSPLGPGMLPTPLPERYRITGSSLQNGLKFQPNMDTLPKPQSVLFRWLRPTPAWASISTPCTFGDWICMASYYLKRPFTARLAVSLRLAVAGEPSVDRGRCRGIFGPACSMVSGLGFVRISKSASTMPRASRFHRPQRGTYQAWQDGTTTSWTPGAILG